MKKNIEKKLSILFCLVLFIMPFVQSYTEIQYSNDNITWQHAGYSNDNKIILETLDNGINAENQYYFRLRNIYSNSTSNWTYINTYTEPGGNSMIIGTIIILPILLGLILLFSAFTLNPEQHPALKIFLFLLSIITFFVSMHFGLVALIELYNFPALENLMGSTVYWMTLVFGVIVMYFFIYLIYHAFKMIAEKKQERWNY